jgi:Ca-activated chloride channel family protein
MTFVWPLALLGLLAVPLAVLLYLLAQRRRRREAERFGAPALVSGLVSARPGWRRHAPFALALAALTVLVLGVARPEATVSVPKEEATIVLALDTSRSMAADDVLPSRLQAAQEAARGFLDHVPEKYRVAIVSFSTEAQIVLQPSVDREAAALALGELRLGSGTAIGDAIVRSLETVRPALATVEPGGPPPAPSPDDVPATVLLLSDGAQTSGQAEPAQAASLAQRLGVPVNTVALGTAAAVVEVPLPGGLRERVMVEPDPATLRAVAEQTGGRFYEAPDADSLQEVYAELGSRLGSKEEKRELTQVFAAAGGALLLVGSALSMVWFRRPL